MKRSATSLSLVFATLLLACDTSPASAPSAEQLLPFETLASRSNSGFDDPGLEVVRDQLAWEASWAKAHRGNDPVPPLPQIDFGRDLVLVAAMGQQPNGCHAIAIDSLILRPSSLAINVRESEGGRDCVCTQQLVEPMHAVVIQRTEQPTALSVERRVEDCA